MTYTLFYCQARNEPINKGGITFPPSYFQAYNPAL